MNKIIAWFKSLFKKKTSTVVIPFPSKPKPEEPKPEVPQEDPKPAARKSTFRAKRIPFAHQCAFKMKEKGSYPTGWPYGAIVHFTAGRDGAEKTLRGGVENGYTFLCIQKDGEIFQAHDCDKYGYHAGESKWKFLGSSVSDKVVGIEINNAGRVDKQSDGRFKTWFKTYLEASEVRYTPGIDNQEKGYYEKYTPQQEATLVKTLLWMKEQDPKTFSFEYVLGHDEVAGMKGLGRWRKNDPGAALSMTMTDFRKLLQKLWDDGVRYDTYKAA